MNWITTIAIFIGNVLREILPLLVKIWQKPKGLIYAGRNKKRTNEIKKQIDDERTE